MSGQGPGAPLSLQGQETASLSLTNKRTVVTYWYSGAMVPQIVPQRLLVLLVIELACQDCSRIRDGNRCSHGSVIPTACNQTATFTVIDPTNGGPTSGCLECADSSRIKKTTGMALAATPCNVCEA